jgi:hypothetical protein
VLEDDSEAVQLFNESVVVPTNDNLEETGFLRGDENEARDSSVRGYLVCEF